MTGKIKAIGIGVAVVLVGILFWWLNRDKVIDTPPGTLPPGDIARIVVRGRTVTTITKEKTTREFAPGGADIRVHKGGDVTVRVQKFGLTLEPGVGVGYVDYHGKLVVDAKVIYWRRMGGHIGVTLDPTRKVVADIARPAAFVSYALPIKWLEDLDVTTSFCVGSELFPQKTLGIIRFGF